MISVIIRYNEAFMTFVIYFFVLKMLLLHILDILLNI